MWRQSHLFFRADRIVSAWIYRNRFKTLTPSPSGRFPGTAITPPSLPSDHNVAASDPGGLSFSIPSCRHKHPRHHYENDVEPSEVYHKDNYGSESSAAGLNDYNHPDPYGQPDTDSDHDVYGQRLGPSGESLNGGRSSAPNLSDFWGTSVQHWP
ncbi:hypothetical protein BJV77DRAFT_358972 [Russula vinacea]|nr:hypothetical protein BJV77DRAFT_358972 [Russula vinacea]